MLRSYYCQLSNVIKNLNEKKGSTSYSSWFSFLSVIIYRDLNEVKRIKEMQKFRQQACITCLQKSGVH